MNHKISQEIAIKKEPIFFAIIREENGALLSYKIDPTLTVGKNPRSDVILTDPNAGNEHLKLVDQNGTLVLKIKTKEHPTYLSGKKIDFENTILGLNDVITIGSIKISFKREMGLRELPIRPNLINLNIEENKIAINDKIDLNLLDEDTDPKNEILDQEAQTITRLNRKKENDSYLVNFKKINFSIKWDFITRFVMGLIFDFYFCYFILSLFSGIKMHLYIFYSIFEVFILFSARRPIGHHLIQYKFNRQYAIWIMLLMFILYPLTKGSFKTPVYKTPITKSYEIELHPRQYQGMSTSEALNLSAELHDNEYLFVDSKGEKINLNFYFFGKKEILEVPLVDVYDTIKLNKYIYRTHPFKIPLKTTMDPILQKRELKKILEINQESFKDIFLENGPFLSFINDTKTFFLKGLQPPIKSIETDDKTPVIILKDKVKTKIFIIGRNKIYELYFFKPQNILLETEFIEKILAKIEYNLINQTTSKDEGFLSLFESLPNINYKLLLDLYQNDIDLLISKNETELLQLYKRKIEDIERIIKYKKIDSDKETIDFERLYNKLKIVP